MRIVTNPPQFSALQQKQQLEQMLEQQRQDSRNQQEMMQQQLEQMTKLHQLEKVPNTPSSTLSWSNTNLRITDIRVTRPHRDKMYALGQEKAELQVQKLTADLEAALAERDEAVCAATRAMMPPPLQGEELDVLMSVLPEEEQEKERTRLSFSPPAKMPAPALTPFQNESAVPPPNGHHELKDASSAQYV